MLTDLYEAAFSFADDFEEFRYGLWDGMLSVLSLLDYSYCCMTQVMVLQKYCEEYSEI
jgi:hypothetical protein